MNANTQEIYSEVYSVLNLLGSNYISKLPKKILQIIETEKSDTYNPNYNKNVKLTNQNIKRETLSMIALFHLNYWCSSIEEKNKLKQLFSDNEKKYQAELKEKYTVDNLFKDRKKQEATNISSVDNKVAMVEYKDSLIKKIINKVKKIFHVG